MCVIIVRVRSPIKASRWNLCMTEYPSEVACQLRWCDPPDFLTFPDDIEEFAVGRYIENENTRYRKAYSSHDVAIRTISCLIYILSMHAFSFIGFISFKWNPWQSNVFLTRLSAAKCTERVRESPSVKCNRCVVQKTEETQRTCTSSRLCQ